MRGMMAIGLLLLAFSGCDYFVTPTQTLEPQMGRYFLRVVGDDSVPVVIRPDENDWLEMSGSILTLGTRQTYEERVSYRSVQQPGSLTRVWLETNLGRYTHSGGELIFESAGGDRFTGRLSGDTLTLVGTTMLVYTRIRASEPGVVTP